MDPALVDPFGFQAGPLSDFGQAQNQSNVAPSSYYDTPPVYADPYPDQSKAPSYASIPATPPPVPVSQSAEPYMPGLSTASGPSIASASSSAIGSPYSGTTQAIQDNWVDTNHGLGLQSALMGDLLPTDYVGHAFDADAYYQKKSSDNFISEWPRSSSNLARAC